MIITQVKFPFHWPRAHHVTCKQLHTNNGVLIRNVVQMCLAANNILLFLRKNGRSLRFPKIFIKKIR